jgi:VanZ family protein
MPLKALLAWSWTIVILVLCWIPRMFLSGEEKLPKPFFVPNFDKLVHMGIFAVFAVLWMRVGSSSRRAWWVVAAGVALAVITELGQEIPIVNRDCNVADGLADSVGVIVGLVAYFLAQKLLVRRTVPAEV